MIIVTMEKCHVPQIAAMEKRFFSAPWDENSISLELSNPLSYWLVAVDEDTVVGYVGSQTVLGESDMMNLAVHPYHQRQGIGERLVLALIEGLKEKGSRCLTLEVRASNVPAKKLYEKLGFQMVGKRKKYYQRPREEADILRKEWET